MAEILKELPESQLPDAGRDGGAVAPRDRVSLALDYRRKGLSLKETGRLLGVSRQAVSKMLAKSGIDPGEVEVYRQEKNLIFHAKQKKMVDKLDDKKLDRMSGAQLLVGIGILQDKLAALENPISGILGSGIRWVDLVTLSHRSLEKDVTPREVEDVPELLP